MPKTTKRFYCSSETLDFINRNGNGRKVEELIKIIKNKFADDGYALDNAIILIHGSSIDTIRLHLGGKFKSKK